MFLLSWLILLTSGARKQSRNRPAFRLPLWRAFKARPEPNGSNVFSISYGVENDEECLRNCLRHCFRTISETVLERGYIGTPKLTQFSRPDISGKQNSRSFPVPIYRESKTRAVFPSRCIGKAKLAQFSRPDISGKQNSRSFPVPIYREGKTRAVFPSRYIGKPKLTQFSVIRCLRLRRPWRRSECKMRSMSAARARRPGFGGSGHRAAKVSASFLRRSKHGR